MISPLCFAFILLFAALYAAVELMEKHVEKIRRIENDQLTRN